MQFYVNQVWLHKQKNICYRILYIDSSLDLLAWISLENSEKVLPELAELSDIHLLATQNKISLSDEDPYPPVSSENLSLATHDRWKANWALIKPHLSNSSLILQKSIFANTVGSISKANSVSRHKITSLFIKYWQRGMNSAALIPDYKNSSGKGKERKAPEKDAAHTQKVGRRLSEKEKKEIVAAYKLYFLGRPESSLYQAYLNYIALNYSKKDPLLLQPPSLWQFRYWGENRFPLHKRRGAKEGEIITQKDRRTQTSSQQKGVIGPGSLYQIDSTPADIELVSEIDRSILIGSPTLYLVTDVFSGMIVGFYAGLENPSYFCAMLALANAVEDKVEFCQRHNITFKAEDWPSRHLPTNIVADGGELKGTQAENLVNELGISVENTAAYRPDLKGLVEKHFQTVHKNLKTTKANIGLKGQRHGERGVRNARKDACLTPKEYIQIIALEIIDYNKTTYLENYPLNDNLIRQEILPKPILLWNWGMEHCSGQLKSINKKEFLFRLLPRKVVGLTKKGIKLHHQYYNPSGGPPALLNEIISIQLNQQHKAAKIEIMYHPWDLSKLYMPHKESFVTFSISETRSPSAVGRSEWEILQMEEKKRKQKSKSQKDNLNEKAKTIQEIEKILSNAIEKSVPKKNTTQIIKINENKEVVKQSSREELLEETMTDSKIISINRHQDFDDENSFPSLYD